MANGHSWPSERGFDGEMPGGMIRGCCCLHCLAAITGPRDFFRRMQVVEKETS